MIRSTLSVATIVMVTVLLGAGGCERGRDESPAVVPPEPQPGAAAPSTAGDDKPAPPATAVNLADVITSLDQAADARAIMEGPGNKHLGTLYLLDEGDDVVIIGFVNNLAPGVHAIHIHESGDCSAGDFTSAGGHFNPTGQPHAAPFQEQKHVGDLGNLISNIRGQAIFGFRMPGVPLSGSPTAIVGKAFIIHSLADDFTSQPSGAAGERLACGVIQATPGGQTEGQTEGQERTM